MILVVDVGNSSIKIAVMKQNEVLLLQRTHLHGFNQTVSEILLQFPQLTEVAVCAVGETGNIMQQLGQKFEVVFEVKHGISLPFSNLYKSSSLGPDRMALVAGALLERKQQRPMLIVDAGTCVTYDVIDQQNQYLGGAISPGLRLRYTALHNFTSQLPLLKQKETVQLIGDTTDTAIQSGVLNGTAQEMNAVINQYQTRFEGLEIFITGGDSELLIKQLKNRFFATPFLMLQGISHLYHYNKNL